MTLNRTTGLKLATLAVWLFAFHICVGEGTNVCDTIDYTPYDDLQRAFGNCSGNGDCISQKCKCDDGWTGLSDIINTDGVDCQINDYAVKSLWALNLLTVLYAQYKGLPYLFSRWYTFRQKQKLHASKGQNYPLTKSKILVACLIFQFVCFPSMVLFGIVRMTTDTERVGVTFMSTLLFATAKLGFYTANYFYSPTLLAMVIVEGRSFMDKETVMKLLKYSSHANKALALLSVLLGFLPFIVFANDGALDGTATTVYVLYFSGMVISITLIVLQTWYIKVKVVAMLNESYSVSKEEKVLVFRDKIKTMQNSGIRQGGIQVFFYLSFLMIPHMYNLHDYFLPISWITFSVLGRKMYMTTVRDDNQSSKTGAFTAFFRSNNGSKEGISRQPSQGSKHSEKSENIKSVVPLDPLRVRNASFEAGHGASSWV